MKMLEVWRQEAQALIPCGFLKISRDEGFLFVSDFPRRCGEKEKVADALRAAGFEVTFREEMAFLDGTDEKYRLWMEKDFPVPPVTQTEGNMRLVYAAGRMIKSTENEDWALVRYVLRCTGLQDEKGLEKLPEIIALRKRMKAPLSPLAGKILLAYLAQKERESC